VLIDAAENRLKRELSISEEVYFIRLNEIEIIFIEMELLTKK
jgi:hypothetical protein